MTFAEKLNELRTEAKLTQQALADKSGIPLTTIRKLEQAQTSKRINFSFVVRISSALGVKCDAFASCPDILGEAENPSKQATKRGRGRPKSPK